MKRLRKGLAVAAVALVMGSLAVGCGQSGAVKNAISSLSPSRSVTLTPTRSAPATQPAPTSQPSQTAAPTEQATEPATEPAQAGSTAPASGSGSSLLWLWILLGAVIVIGAIVWIARASGRRSAAAAGRRSTLIDAYAKGQALADGLRLADALASLQPLRSAMAAAHAPRGAGEPQAARVRSRLPSFEAAIRALREPERLPRI
jgi:hypothetical protein